MNPVTDPLDPIILSLTGTLSFDGHIHAAIRTGEVEADSTFASFAGTAHTLSPHWFTTKQLEAHEAFWCLEKATQHGLVEGELAWFQTGAYSKEAALWSVPLLVQAGVTSVEQLGTCSIDSVRVQVPAGARSVGEETIQQLLDQFSALADAHPDKKVQAQLFSTVRNHRWSDATDWFNQTYLGPFSMLEANVARSGVRLDNRWSVRQVHNTCRALFSVPEFSPAVAAVLVVLMIEAAQVAGINDTVVVEVSRR